MSAGPGAAIPAHSTASSSQLPARPHVRLFPEHATRNTQHSPIRAITCAYLCAPIATLCKPTNPSSTNICTPSRPFPRRSAPVSEGPGAAITAHSTASSSQLPARPHVRLFPEHATRNTQHSPIRAITCAYLCTPSRPFPRRSAPMSAGPGAAITAHLTAPSTQLPIRPHVRLLPQHGPP